jgi:hypothetical protein
VITPLFGYRTTMNVATEPDAEGVTSKVVVASNPAYGFAVGFRTHDEDVVEFRWSRQETRVHVTGPIVVPSSARVTLDQFHMDCSHEFVVDEWASWVRPFLMASVGATRVSGSEIIGGITRFSFGIGTGIRFFPSRQVGFKVQAEWLPIVMTQNVRALCSGGCILRYSADVASQGEVTIGPVFRF